MTGGRARRRARARDREPRHERTVVPDAAATAATLHRLAVLLEAGIAPDRAWQHLAEAQDETARAVHEARAAGGETVDALAAAGGAWRDVAVAWRVATTVGAPLADSLRSFAEALTDAEQTRDDVRHALADPAATARLVSWLPVVGIGLGLALGFDVLSSLTRPLGAASLVAGALLMLAARRWTSVLVRRAQPGDEVPGLAPDVLAIALSGGVSLERADVVVRRAGIEPDGDAAEVLALSQRAGAPAVELLRAAAAHTRRRARVEGRMRAAVLSSRLLLPMGLCTLPAFLLVGVVPMMLGVMGSGALTL